jgi:hypothetical protein
MIFKVAYRTLQILLLLCIIVFNFAYANQFDFEILKLTISTDKVKYNIGEDIVVKVQLQNISNQSIRVFNILHNTMCVFGIGIIGPDGKDVKVIYSDIEYGENFYKNHLVLLHPSGFVGTLFHLQKQGSGNEEIRYILEKKGIYKICASYLVPKNVFKDLAKHLNGSIWMGTIKSNEITITLE